MRNRVKRETLENARKLRAEPTAFEKALWRELRLLKAQRIVSINAGAVNQPWRARSLSKP